MMGPEHELTPEQIIDQIRTVLESQSVSTSSASSSLSNLQQSWERLMQVWGQGQERPFMSHRGGLGILIVLYKKLTHPFIKPPLSGHLDAQKEMNQVFFDFMVNVKGTLESFDRENKELKSILLDISGQIEKLELQYSAREKSLDDKLAMVSGEVMNNATITATQMNDMQYRVDHLYNHLDHKLTDLEQRVVQESQEKER